MRETDNVRQRERKVETERDREIKDRFIKEECREKSNVRDKDRAREEGKVREI